MRDVLRLGGPPPAPVATWGRPRAHARGRARGAGRSRRSAPGNARPAAPRAGGVGRPASRRQPHAGVSPGRSLPEARRSRDGDRRSPRPRFRERRLASGRAAPREPSASLPDLSPAVGSARASSNTGIFRGPERRVLEPPRARGSAGSGRRVPPRRHTGAGGRALRSSPRRPRAGHGALRYPTRAWERPTVTAQSSPEALPRARREPAASREGHELDLGTCLD